MLQTENNVLNKSRLKCGHDALCKASIKIKWDFMSQQERLTFLMCSLIAMY